MIEVAFSHYRSGRTAEAEESCRQILTQDGDHPAALNLLGLMAHDQKREKVAVELLTRSVTAAPNVPDFRNNFGTVLADLKRFDEAIDQFRAAVRLKPDYAAAQRNLGLALAKAYRMPEAAEAFRAAVKLAPDDVESWQDLTAVLHELGEIDEAIECRRRVIERRPDDPVLHSEMLLSLFYHPRYEQDPAALFAEHVAWAERHAETLYPEDKRNGRDNLPIASVESQTNPKSEARNPKQILSTKFGTGPEDGADHPRSEIRNLQLVSPDRPLRIGYFSPDLREHPVGRYVLPLPANHDRERFIAYCYSDAARPDGTSEQIRRHAAVWRDLVGLSDQQICERIRADRIDILVDLNGHMDTRRLAGVFARKPAPIQVTYGGHPGTTALKTMDWRITDANHDPLGETEAYHTERLFRLPDTCLTYAPGDDTPDVGPLPALARNTLPKQDKPGAQRSGAPDGFAEKDRASGHVTFGSFNRLMKNTAPMLDAWRQILDAVPGSKLTIIGNPEGGDFKGANKPVYERFARHGIDCDRLVILPRQTRPKYLASIERVDIALDPFPYAGETTTFDALWMGVPVVTLAGRSYASRAGVNLLTNVGLTDLIAGSLDDYVRIATGLAKNLDRLSGIRSGLRSRMKSSPLADGGARVCRALEGAFRTMWAEYVSGETSRERERPVLSDGGGPVELRRKEPVAHARGSSMPSSFRPEDEVAPELNAPLPPGLDDRIKEVGMVASKVQGWLDPKAGAILYRLARLHAPAGAVVELGSWKGRSTIWLASAVRDRGDAGAKVWSVDTWAGTPDEDLHQHLLENYGPDQLLEEFRANVRGAGVDGYVEPMRTDTIEASRRWPVDQQIGLLFIDASHDYNAVLRDFEFWSPLVMKGGYIVFDDVPGWPGPTRLTSELPRWYQFVGAAGGVWVVRKGGCNIVHF